MKKIRAGAAMAGALFVLSGCMTGPVSGPVFDKRAPGIPGEKTFQLLVGVNQWIGPDAEWVTVPEKVWGRCHLDDLYPACGS